MSIFRLIILFSFFICTVSLSFAGPLNPQQLERLKETKTILADVNHEPLKDTVKWISSQRNPEIHLEMEEAIAQAYAKLLEDQKLTKTNDKNWLYAKIKLNLAYLQFTSGDMNVTGNDDAVNRLIQKTLKEFLSPEIYAHPGFSKSVE